MKLETLKGQKTGHLTPVIVYKTFRHFFSFTLFYTFYESNYTYYEPYNLVIDLQLKKRYQCTRKKV